MTIEEKAKALPDFTINGIKFVCMGVNCHAHRDAKEKIPYNNDNDITMSLDERCECAEEELKQALTGITTIDEAYKHFKDQTDEGNVFYWGDAIAVYTREPDTDSLSYLIRMD